MRIPIAIGAVHGGRNMASRRLRAGLLIAVGLSRTP